MISLSPTASSFVFSPPSLPLSFFLPSFLEIPLAYRPFRLTGLDRFRRSQHRPLACGGSFRWPTDYRRILPVDLRASFRISSRRAHRYVSGSSVGLPSSSPFHHKSLTSFCFAPSGFSISVSCVNLSSPLHSFDLRINFLALVSTTDIAVFPIALSVRSTNVYEEKSLGVYVREEGVTPEDPEPDSNGPKGEVFGFVPSSPLCLLLPP